MNTRRHLATWAANVALAAAVGGLAWPAGAAEPFPARPVRFVVGFSPGNSTDTVARILAEGLRSTRNWTVVVDNHPGANGILGAGELQRAPPDGYTVLISNSSSITVNPLLYKKLPYDAAALAAVTSVVSIPFILTVNPENDRVAGVKTLAALLDLAKKKPGALLYGSAGVGNLIQLATEMLCTSAKVQMTHVPFRGAAPMEAAVLGSTIDLSFDTTAAVPLVQGGKLSALAVSAAERWPDLPDVPTVAEQGFPGYDMSFWIGVFLPPATPDGIVDTMYQAVKAAIEDAATHALLVQQGRVTNPAPPQFAEKIKAETARNAVIISDAGIELQ